jgi:hypothetical protein
MISASMPSDESIAAAFCATWTIELVATKVMSRPAFRIFALPKGIRYSSSGTGAFS